MEDRFGYGAIVRAMRPEEREEMLGLLLEAVAGEMPAGAEEEPPEACPRCGCPPHRQEGPRRRRGAKEALPRVRPQLPGVDGAGARHHQAARGDLGALRRGDVFVFNRS